VTLAADLRQAHPLPSDPKPIVILGAGGIVNDAHLPAYRKAGFAVAGVYDRNPEQAHRMSEAWSVPVFDSLEAAVATKGCVFDVAAPHVAHVELLTALPQGAAVLLQKPMGVDLEGATRIRDACRARKLVAAVNFQLRFSPMMQGVADALERGLLGRVVDVEAHLNLVTPWSLFPHLKADPRVEIVSHSIHYLDLVRGLLGEPRGVLARSYGHPDSGLADTRTSAILDFDDPLLRVTLSINHHHDFGRRFQDASFRFEGDKGAALVKLGLLLNYPEGEPDELWLAPHGGPWSQVPLAGRWFPDAFIGVMSNLQRFAAGEDARLVTSVEDAWRTMALVEACYGAARAPGVPIPTP
jgi:predicted dehydrogenase